ncbi:hypothetical protein POSPLADRAFT_1055357 [Postia placenta MAD-698-R-SB12]|uniref:Uncharacterized protein n=1 Tax=Postia placenta MAD-698-R-SB12 TaxID=670580 RepID=A0A1X6N3T2_9APHY|nr:hypothetical protein POSPLADRAFT_1055357 [Postia placenta MAD-698-R-SB12]OSX63301.1 hypothetical protein POSPLADRAFT_1055357 [Postia placenta MAD-698-R-SB12]
MVITNTFGSSKRELSASTIASQDVAKLKSRQESFIWKRFPHAQNFCRSGPRSISISRPAIQELIRSGHSVPKRQDTPESDFPFRYCHLSPPRPSLSRSPEVGPGEIESGGESFPFHVPLISLSAARTRNDIRRRVEGFEMDRNLQRVDIPAAVQNQMLISLTEALARDDIRRRDEGFEVDTEQSTHGDHAPPKCENNGDTETSKESRPFSPASTIPSVYSADSWVVSVSNSVSWIVEEVTDSNRAVRERLLEAVLGNV